MPRDHSTNILAGWECYEVKLVEPIEPVGAASKPRVEVTLERARWTFRCSGCGRGTTKVHSAGTKLLDPNGTNREAVRPQRAVDRRRIRPTSTLPGRPQIDRSECRLSGANHGHQEVRVIARARMDRMPALIYSRPMAKRGIGVRVVPQDVQLQDRSRFEQRAGRQNLDLDRHDFVGPDGLGAQM